MSTFRLMGAGALLSIVFATPVLAQHVISEPGYCAFFYPNANCQNKGPGNPYTDPNYRHTRDSAAWSTTETVGVAGQRQRTHRRSAVRTQY